MGGVLLISNKRTTFAAQFIVRYIKRDLFIYLTLGKSVLS